MAVVLILDGPSNTAIPPGDCIQEATSSPTAPYLTYSIEKTRIGLSRRPAKQQNVDHGCALV